MPAAILSARGGRVKRATCADSSCEAASRRLKSVALAGATHGVRLSSKLTKKPQPREFFGKLGGLHFAVTLLGLS